MAFVSEALSGDTITKEILNAGTFIKEATPATIWLVAKYGAAKFGQSRFGKTAQLID
jgi:hypothetical protein